MKVTRVTPVSNFSGASTPKTDNNSVQRSLKANLKNQFKSKSQCGFVLKISLLMFQVLVFLACTGFVISGWYRSGVKYLDYKTAIAKSINETDQMVFPSVTFCRGFKYPFATNLKGTIVDLGKEMNVKYVDQIDLQEVIANATYERQTYLSSFVHSKYGNPLDPNDDVLNRNEFWEVTVPHPEYSGTCHTYNPSFKSPPGENFGIRLKFLFPETSGKSLQEKEDILATVSVYIHERDNFFFFTQDERPGMAKLDTSWLRLDKETLFNFEIQRFTQLDTKDNPCLADPKESFLKCVEKYHSNVRGCQPPWFYFKNFNISVCNDLEDLDKLIDYEPIGTFQEKYWSMPSWSTNGIRSAEETNCRIPCTRSIFKPNLSFRNKREFDDEDEWVVILMFRNYQLQFDDEFVVCDWTCLLGEIGGNLGFFLGGSILMYSNYIFNPMIKTV